MKSPLRIPLIFVSGPLREERAIESLKRGASSQAYKRRGLSPLAGKMAPADHVHMSAQDMEELGKMAAGVAHDFIGSMIQGGVEHLIATIQDFSIFKKTNE